MKCKIIIFLLYILYIQFIFADNMTIMNLMSQPATVTLRIGSKNFTTTANPNENLYVQQNLDNANNIQYDNPLTTLSYDHGQIQKIIVQRAESNMPQIIYYNDEITVDTQNKASGLYGTFVSRGGNLQILHDTINLNNLVYAANDLNSIKIKIEFLKNQLQANKDIKNDLNDISESLRSIELSDSVSTISLQISVIKSEFEQLINLLNIQEQTKDYLQNIENLEKNLTQNNVDATQDQVNNMLTNLSILDPTDTKKNKIKEKIDALQNQINAIKYQLKKTHRPMLINADSPSI